MNDGGPAFPGRAANEQWTTDPANSPEYIRVVWPGMTIRDFFAASALAGLLAQHSTGLGGHDPVYRGDFLQPGACAGDQMEAAIEAYRFADAMLVARVPDEGET